MSSYIAKLPGVISQITCNNFTPFCTRCLVLLGLVLSAGCTQPAASNHPETMAPTLVIDESVQGDFEAVAQESWTKFLETFEFFHACIGTVTLKAETGLADRAFYQPDTSELTVRVPATRVVLEAALIHEWAHHLEYHCDEHLALREPFLEAVGFPPGTTWRPDDQQLIIPASEWAEIPSEQYAETVVTLVLGHRSAPTNAPVTQAGVEIIEKWAGGFLEKE